MNLVFERKKEEIINIENPLDKVEWNPCKVSIFNFGGKKRIHECMLIEDVGSVCKIFDEKHNLIETNIQRL